MVTTKTSEEIKILREGGKILASVLFEISKKVKPGIFPLNLNEFAKKLIKKTGGEPSFENYKSRGDKNPYPAALCVSVNDEVVHGIPDMIPLKEGDIVSLDLGMKWGGLYTDAAITVPVGKISIGVEKLLNVTKISLEKGIGVIKSGIYTGDIGFAIQSYVEKNGFNVVRKLIGHGVGYSVHEDPEIPNWGEKKTGFLLKEGMVIAIEPMVTFGDGDVFLDKDNWTWRTKDKSLAAHFEHTAVITRKGCEVLTPYLF